MLYTHNLQLCCMRSNFLLALLHSCLSLPLRSQFPSHLLQPIWLELPTNDPPKNHLPVNVNASSSTVVVVVFVIDDVHAVHTQRTHNFVQFIFMFVRWIEKGKKISPWQWASRCMRDTHTSNWLEERWHLTNAFFFISLNKTERDFQYARAAARHLRHFIFSLALAVQCDPIDRRCSP